MHQQPPTDTHETVLTTDIIDLRITGQHPVPQWLHEPEPPAILLTVAYPLESRGGSGGSGSSGEGDEQR